MAIRLLLPVILLSAHTVYAQKGSLYLRPYLGVHTPLSEMVRNYYTKSKLTNNVPYVTLYYGLSMEYELKKKQAVYLQYTNGISGYSIHEKANPCNTGYTGINAREGRDAAVFNNKRINIGYRRPVFKPFLQHKSYMQAFVQAGIAVDIKGTEDENQPPFIAIGPNRCGEIYYLDKIIIARSSLSLALPLQVSFQRYNKNSKPTLQLALFANLGLTTNLVFDINYVNQTLGTVERAHFVSRGSSYGFSLSYPIVLKRPKKNK
jgi:hypothetical protein